MKRYCNYTKLLALPLAAALQAGAQDPGITRKQADEILNELRQIRQLLEKQGGKPPSPAPPEPAPRAKLNLEGVPMLGSRNAPLTMVEYTDYECPFCQRFHLTSYAEIKKSYIDTGKLRFYSRDLPLDFHANAMRAAMAARCANEQGQYWTLREIMSANPDKLQMENLVANAASLKMNVEQFRTCVESGKYKNAVQTDVMEAMKIGANGTPSFVIGRSTPEGVDGELVVGALPFAVFDAKLKELLGGK
jgi:protein-disulfide isomerase